MSDADKLHEIKLLAQDWYDDYPYSEVDIETVAEVLLGIVDPDNQRLKPPPPPTPEEMAERERSHREWRIKVEAERKVASEAVVLGYLADCERLGLEPPKDLTVSPAPISGVQSVDNGRDGE